VLSDDVGALIDQGLGGIGLLAGIVPGVTQITLTSASGLTFLMASVKALIPRITSGIGKDAT
jgi:hypothetical protein